MRKSALQRRECPNAGCRDCLCAFHVAQREYNSGRAAARRAAKPPQPRKTLVDLFWEKVEKTGGCWLWRGATNPKGYGRTGVGSHRSALAHRLSWNLAHGQIPAGLFVLHRCDTPGCVRPDHLFLGTAADNTADMIRKGRQYSRPIKSTCSAGHAFDEANTRISRDASGYVGRHCRTCERARYRGAA